jgi:hypothetical protein
VARYSEEPEIASLLLRMAAQARFKDRTSGPPHVTDLVYCLRKGWANRNGLPKPRLTESEQATMLVGEAHHVILQSLNINEEMQVEVPFTDLRIPMQGTVDGKLPVVLYNDERAVLEIKSTRSSSNKTPEELEHYTEQLASYCYANDLTLGILAILHILGDYKDHKPSRLKVWVIRFTKQELEAWGRELKRRSAVVSGVVEPAIGDHYTWECTYCGFSKAKGGYCPGGIGRTFGWFSMEESPSMSMELENV